MSYVKDLYEQATQDIGQWIVYRAARKGKKYDFLILAIVETVAAETSMQIPTKFQESTAEQGTGAKFTIAKDDLPFRPKQGDLIFEIIQEDVVPENIKPTGVIYKVGHIRPVVFHGHTEFYEVFAEVSEMSRKAGKKQ